MSSPKPMTPKSPKGSSSAARTEAATTDRTGQRAEKTNPPPAPSLREGGRLGVLRHKHFRNVWIAAFVSSVGGWMEMVGVQMIVAKVTGSLTMLGYFAAAQLLPILFLGIFGGLVADRVNRKKLLLVTQTILMLIAAGVAAAAYWQADLPTIPWMSGICNGLESTGFVAALFLLSLMQGVVMAFNIPAWQVLTPRLVPKDELTRAITLNGIQFNAARVLGPALAGVILGEIGATPLFVVNTFTFLAVLLAASTTPDAPAPPQDGKRPWPQIREAAAFILGDKGALCVFAAMVLMSLLAAPLMRMMPLYVMYVYGMTGGAADSVTGTLISVLGVGAVLGGLALKYVPSWYPKHHFIPLALTGCGLTMVLFGLTTNVVMGYVAMFVVGLFWIWGFNPAWAAMQNLVTDQMRGRVLAISNVAAFGVTAIGNVAAAYFGDGIEALLASGRFGTWSPTSAKEIGTHAAVVGPSAVLLVAGLVMLVWRVPEVDGLKPGDPEYGPRRSLWEGITARTHREHERRRRGLCHRCEYDLSDTEGAVCPECGASVSLTPAKGAAWEPETEHAGAK